MKNAAEGEVIYIGVLANRGNELCLLEWGPTADYLSEHFSHYEFRILPLNFDEILEEVSRPDTRISFVSVNSSYYTYMEYHGLAHRIATLQIPGTNGPQSSFGGVILTRADRTDIREIADLSNKHFAAVDSRSLGGWQTKGSLTYLTSISSTARRNAFPTIRIICQPCCIPNGHLLP